MNYAALLPHLWQSTLCVLIAWALTLALRNNRAAVRYWIWLAASVKFLIPLSLLVSLGAQFGVRMATSSAQPQLSAIVNQISVPAGFAPVIAAPVSTAPDRLPAVLFALWLCGAAIALLVWFRSWWNIRALRRSATPLDLNLPVPVMSSTARLEPGVFGVFKPVLLLPEGITNRLTPDQLKTVVAHELCHIRRRDNLTAVLHMLVETLFWFHPLVWWIGSRLADERERACDESVLQSAGEPEVYAGGILQVCRLYLESPIACMSGISGADLRARIQRIVSGALIHDITLGRKLLLAAVALAVAGVPLLVGVLTPRLGRAEQQASDAKKLPQFGVASIRPSKQDGTSWECLPGGRVRGVTTLLGLIALAYKDEVPDFQIVNVPKWGESDRYAISAIPPESSESAKIQYRTVYPSKEQQQMLQSLLIERFHLKFHREFRKEQAYLLFLKNKPDVMKLQPPPKDEHEPSHLGLFVDNTATGSIPFSLVARNSTMSFFAREVSGFTKMNVIDRTGLAGSYDFRVPCHYHQEESGKETGSEFGAAVFTGLREFGFDLKSVKKMPIEHIVIDHVDRPSEN